MNTPDHPIKLTFVICTYNNAETLALTLKHIEDQGAEDLRDTTVLVIDNCSTDSTPEVVREAQARGKIPDLHRILETRQGVVYARVRGVAEARTEWVAFIDDDNLLQPGWIKNARNFIATHPRCGVFGGHNEIVWEAPAPALLRENEYAYAGLNIPGGTQRLEGQARWRLKGAGMVIRTSACIKSGFLDFQACVGRQARKPIAGEDTEILMRIAREGFEVWYEPGCHLKHLIAARRVNKAYIMQLHYGFGMALPLCLGFKRRQTRLMWATALVWNLIGLTRQHLISIFNPARRSRACLTWAFLKGAFAGIPHALKLGPVERAKWLGQTSSPAVNVPRTATSTVNTI